MSTISKPNNVDNIKSQRKEIQDLIRSLSKNEIISEIDECWVAPGDKHISVDILDSNPDDSTIFLKHVLGNSNFSSYDGMHRVDRRLHKFSNVSQPTETTTVCPALPEIEKLLSSRSLYMSFHSITGYDFSAEFEHVYDGNMTIKSVYANNRIICWRAIAAVCPNVPDNVIESYVDYILRIAAWEATLAYAICDHTMKTKYPSIQCSSDLTASPSKFSSIRVYITSNPANDELVILLRTCPSVYSTLTNNDLKRFQLTSKDLVQEKKLEALIKCCYYRKHFVNPDAVALLNAEMKKGKDEVPYSPVLTNPNDLRVYIMVMNSNELSVLLDKPDSNSKHGLYDVLDYDSSDEHQTQDKILGNAVVSGAGGGKQQANDFYYWDYEEGQVSETDKLNDDTQSIYSNHSHRSEISRNTANSNRSYRNRIDQYKKSTTSVVPLESSSTAELLGWGQNTYNSLGFSTKSLKNSEEYDEESDLLTGSLDRNNRKNNNIIHEPTAVPLPAPLLFERIKMVSCSSRHSLLLTTMGFVYSSGENSEGALGTGDMVSRTSFTLISLLSTLLKKHNRSSDLLSEIESEDESDNDSEIHSKTKASSITDSVAYNVNDAAGKIVKISAGAGLIGAHSMAIDSSGNLYGWGVPYAVGLGNVKPVLSPALINPSFPTVPLEEDEEENEDEAVREGENDDEDATTATRRRAHSRRRQRRLNDRFVVDVACGDCFTVAVMKSGVVASWGLWSHGRLGLGPVPYIHDKRSKKHSRKIAKYKLKPAYIPNLRNMVKVACGDAHVLCLNKQGEVYTWGRNNSGQLGIGCTVSGFLIDLFAPAKIALFAADKLNVNGSKAENEDADGRLSRSGSLVSISSHGTTPSERMASQKRSSRARSKRVCVVDVCCGSKHSLVIDKSHDVWSWGHCGHPCLGHGDSGVEGAWASRIDGIFGNVRAGNANPEQNEAKSSITGGGTHATAAVGANLGRVMVPHELIPWVSEWSQPRRLISIHEIDIVSLSAGEDHSVFLSSAGQMFLCGTGPVVPPFISNALLSKGESTTADERMNSTVDGNPQESATDNLGTAESKLDEKSSEEFPDTEPELKPDESEEVTETSLLRQKYGSDRFNIVAIPRCPSSSWLSGVCTRRFVHIASAGYKCFIIQDEEFVVPSLMGPLLHLASGGGTSGAKDDLSQMTDDSDNASVASSQGTAYTNASVLETRGKVDCMLISSGRVNLVHRAFLVQRSNVIRDMVLLDTPMEEEEWMSQPTQLLMPELHKETANALVHYLYTDTLPKESLSNISLLYALSHAATSLQINRLKLLCDNLLSTLSIIMLSNQRINSDDDDSSDMMSRNEVAEELNKVIADMPPTTLARDLGALIGDPQFADVRFIIEGKTIAAHRFILEARSDYFKKMFRSGFAESDGSNRMVDVVIPGSFVGFLRLLLFMYTSTLPDGSDAALLEDLETANR